jgi:uncharacterized protein (TIGR00369 family)
MATLGATLESVTPGAVVIGVPVAGHIAQQHGFVHGGAVAAIADSAAGYAALSLMPEGAGVLTVEFKINFLAPAAGERLEARGRVIKPGRTLTLAEAEVFALQRGPDGALAAKRCAHLTATMMTVAGREGVSD